MLYDRIKAFVERLAPDLVCQKCVAERLGLGQGHSIGLILQELAGQRNYERQIGACALCSASTEAIRFRGR